jgi:hypothetical protein
MHVFEDLMRRSLVCGTGLLLSLGTAVYSFAQQPSSARAVAAAESGWIRLFDGKSLDGWYTKLQNLTTNDDPAKVFQVHDGAIHVYKDQADGAAVPFGYLATEAEYAYYHLRMEYKWGTKKFRPRTMVRRDAGLLYHVVGPDTVWPQCMECQIQEGDVGDFFTVRTQITAPVEIVSVDTPMGVKKLPRYKPEAQGGVPKTVGDGGINRIVKASTHERDGWNSIELIVHGGDKSRHIVNGETVFEGSALRRLAPTQNPPATPGNKPGQKVWEPLARGRIALQCEFAEVFYRNIEIRPIPEGPLHGATEKRTQ